MLPAKEKQPTEALQRLNKKQQKWKTFQKICVSMV
ncbi:hypothetical protein HID58_078538 [Brassica napus]|uniref:Uncharacterized protein n=1 Tax=Brassica napus TaxID=3708 RepID=A0ABQ7YUA9_BRANA|nr:hypothetical protein HID58_078538 [Brassica napus]